MKKAAVGAPNGTLGVQSFGSAKPQKLRLPLRDEADLMYVFRDMRGEAGIRSPDPRPEEEARMTIPCVVCGKIFEAKSKSQTVCPEPRCHGAIAFRSYVSEEMKTPPVSTGGVHRVEIGDGRSVLAYSVVTVRRMPSQDGIREPDPIKVHAPAPGADTRLMDAEEWVESGKRSTHVHRKHLWGWKCLQALKSMHEDGKTREVDVLRRVYGEHSPGARTTTWDRDLAQIVGLTPTVAKARRDMARGLVESRSEAAGEMAGQMDVGHCATRGGIETMMEHGATEIEEAREHVRTLTESGAKPRPMASAILRLDRLERNQESLRSTLVRIEHNGPSRTASHVRELAHEKIRQGTELEIDVEAAIAHALDAPTQRIEGESDYHLKTRQRADRERRKVFIAQVAKEAEQLLVSAGAAYRSARRELNGPDGTPSGSGCS